MNRLKPENILARITLEREEYEGNQHDCGRRVVIILMVVRWGFAVPCEYVRGYVLNKRKQHSVRLMQGYR